MHTYLLRIDKEKFKLLEQKSKDLDLSVNAYINKLIDEQLQSVLQKNTNIEMFSRINHLINVVDKQTIELNKLSHANEITVNILADLFGIHDEEE
ncbi:MULTISPECIES: hypothetical protein [Bacillales]|uniref:Uncharacterized protein n=2 Tax=Bacillales TaxID=1385 RepID=A0A6V7R6C4_9BACL|nr:MULTISPECIES: hypothetical protein [Staphylococcaceae]MBP1939850.1 putative ubiquitin-like protein YukD [Jeotgalicoccus pinnipedialis]QRN92770.1 hypothetical protein JRU67_14965 [Mammaliicoccus sciuri]RXY94809.1 hypothetical protein DD607_05080 [Salmonella sp. 3DZ2-4SM]CAD2072578.1 hypothetical protein JEOPIN946_00571 [Jeotgalicoccus pinnipedialis]